MYVCVCLCLDQRHPESTFWKSPGAKALKPQITSVRCLPKHYDIQWRHMASKPASCPISPWWFWLVMATTKEHLEVKSFPNDCWDAPFWLDSSPSFTNTWLIPMGFKLSSGSLQYIRLWGVWKMSPQLRKNGQKRVGNRTLQPFLCESCVNHKFSEQRY